MPPERPHESDRDWDLIEATVAAFEAAWIREERPPIAAYLDAAGSLRAAILVELVHSELEFRLKEGEPARVEAYLADWPELADRPGVLVDLVRAEWALRDRREPGLTIGHFLDRFPDRAAELAASLAAPGPERPANLPATIAGPGTTLDLPLPRRLGKYELRQKVGGGGFGFVFRAWDAVLQRDVAIKIPRPEVAQSPTDVVYFLREARNAIHLRHPNIVAIQDAGPIDGTICLVSEFIEGTTLADRLRVGALDVDESVAMMVGVLEALSHAHRRGIIHRDLKPSNILIDGDGAPHLTDFGLAKRSTGDSTLSPWGATRVLIGTPAYMAPEQARGDSSNVDSRSDVYTAGVVLYEMLTGSVPFRGRGRLLQVQIEEADPAPPRELNDEIPRDLESICLKAMAKHPVDRYASAGAMADDLANFQGGRPVSARPVVPPAPVPWRRHRRGIRRALGGGAALVAAAGLAAEWRGLEHRAAEDSRLIARLVQGSVDATRLPFQGGTSPADEHRRLVDALWKQSQSLHQTVANRPELIEARADLAIRSAQLAAEAGSDPATRAAWEEAVAALEPIVRDRPTSWRRRADLARSLAALGKLQAQAGRRDEGRHLSERAAETWQQVIGSHRARLAAVPNHVPTRLDLAEAILEADRAARAANQGGAPGAVAEVEQIANDLQGLTPAAPPAEESSRLGEVQLGLARRCLAFGQFGQSIAWGRQALKTAERDGPAPTSPGADPPAARALLLIGLATAEADRSSPPDAPGGTVASLRSAINRLARAGDDDPLDLDLRRDRAAAEAGLAAYLLRRGRDEQAIPWFRGAIGRYDALCRAHPLRHADLAAFAEVEAGRARIDFRRGRNWPALARTARAIVLVQRAIWLAPGIAAYRRARTFYLLTLTFPLTHHCPPTPTPKARPAGMTIPVNREVELH